VLLCWLAGQDLAARMQRLGYGAWLYQTVGNVERGKRRVTAEEVLALALDTTGVGPGFDLNASAVR
jgi:hypothetical protein